MTRNRVEGAPAAALLAALLLALLALAERAGLPLPYVKGFLIASGLLAYGLLVALSRTASERVFIGVAGHGGPVQAGLALAAAVWLTGESIVPASTPETWLAALIGGPLGIVTAFALERLAKGTASGEAREPTGGTALLGAVAAAATGLIILALGMDAAQGEIRRILGFGEVAALAVAAAVVLMPTLLGGARGAHALAGAAASVAILILLSLLVIGMGGIGALPLPGQSEGTTLQAISEARERWGIAQPLHLAAWPSAASLFTQEATAAFGIAFATAAALGCAAAPAAQIHRHATMMSAALALAILPLLTTAIGGYAIEAAGTRFIGASAARPPTSLVEASTLGLVRVCGAFSTTPDAMRTACGVAPRDAATLDWSRITLEPAFLQSGLPAALGLPSTLSLSSGVLRLAFSLAAAALGLWIAARAIGRGLLGRRRQAAGLASLRQGLIRIAALAVTAGAATVLLKRLAIPSEAIHVLPVAAAALALVKLLSLRLQTAPESTTTAPPSPVRRRSAQSQAT